MKVALVNLQECSTTLRYNAKIPSSILGEGNFFWLSIQNLNPLFFLVLLCEVDCGLGLTGSCLT